jgi:hypothetical protein
LSNLIPIERVENKIFLIRDQKVILDRDLADLYGVTTKQLNQAVTRNATRFPDDFMFQLNENELQNLRSHFVTANWEMVRFPPRAFTEQGVAMLSSVLRGERAVQVNIMIMRAFVKMREIMSEHKELAKRIDNLEKKYDKQFTVVFDAIRQLMAPPPAAKKKFGFHTGKDESGKKIVGRRR